MMTISNVRCPLTDEAGTPFQQLALTHVVAGKVSEDAHGTTWRTYSSVTCQYGVAPGATGKIDPVIVPYDILPPGTPTLSSFTLDPLLVLVLIVMGLLYRWRRWIAS